MTWIMRETSGSRAEWPMQVPSPGLGPGPSAVQRSAAKRMRSSKRRIGGINQGMQSFLFFFPLLLSCFLTFLLPWLFQPAINNGFSTHNAILWTMTQ